MDERRNRSDKITRLGYYALLIYAIGLFIGALLTKALMVGDCRDLQPHVAEFYCTQDKVGKVYSVYSNYPFVAVREEEDIGQWRY